MVTAEGSHGKLTAAANEIGYGKSWKSIKPISTLPTATTTTNYNQLWDTDSEGKVRVSHKGPYASFGRSICWHLFAFASFESTPPKFMNRHWILHGRLATEWTAIDAIKLLNALGTAKAMFPSK
jgi:hypothetical protein